MGKIEKKKLITGAVTIAVFAAVILLVRSSVFKTVVGACKPLIYAVIIAYILWPLIKLIENGLLKGKLEKKGPNRKGKRIIAMILTYIVFFAVMTFLIYGIVPQIASSVQVLGVKANDFIGNADTYFEQIPDTNIEFINQFKNNIAEYLSQALGWAWNVLKNSVSNITSYIIRLVTEIKNVLFGLFFSIYFILFKESIFAQISKFMHALTSDHIYERSAHYIGVVDNAFGGFLKGKLLDSVIIGAITAVTMSILGMPYVVLISMIVLITNMIPVIGPLIGAVPSALILLIAEPRHVIPFLILILVIQQLDGNIIGPKILSSYTCLNPLWIIIAVTAMGGLLGTFGMFLGVPTFAVIYSIVKELVEARLTAKNLPLDTIAYYADKDYVPIVNGSVLRARAKADAAKKEADEASADALNG